MTLEQISILLLLFAALYCVGDMVWRLVKGPYRCDCGYETYNADEALRHQGHKRHKVK